MFRALPQKITLRRVNNVLTCLVVTLGLYIVAMPLLPNVAWWTAHEAPLISTTASVVLPEKPVDIPADPTLIIPSLALQETIHEGAYENTLSLGIWHRPDSSSPDTAGNTVMAAHRSTKNGPGVFYHLDKVAAGADIYVYWNKKQFHYIADRISVVPPTDVSVEAPTAKPTLTLYTCTPLWSFKNRLVVQAHLEGSL